MIVENETICPSALQDSLLQLEAVDSVLGAVVEMLPSLPADQSAKFDQDEITRAYVRQPAFVQREFHRHCLDLAVLARSGAGALMRLRAEGAGQLEPAAIRLVREAQQSRRKIRRLLG